MPTETAREGPDNAGTAPEATVPAIAPSADLAWTVVQMRAGTRIVIDEALIAAYQASPQDLFARQR